MKRTSKPRKNRPKRPLGLCRGQIWMAPDFDQPLPRDILEGFGIEPDIPKKRDQTKVTQDETSLMFVVHVAKVLNPL